MELSSRPVYAAMLNDSGIGPQPVRLVDPGGLWGYRVEGMRLILTPRAGQGDAPRGVWLVRMRSYGELSRLFKLEIPASWGEGVPERERRATGWSLRLPEGLYTHLSSAEGAGIVGTWDDYLSGRV